MKALVLASGEGKRLRPLTENTNKGMLKVKEIPVLEHIIIHLRNFGINKIILAVGVKKEQVMEYFGDGKKFGVDIEYSVSDCCQGTAGEVANARKFLEKEENFILYYGDTLTNLDMIKFIESHKESNSVITGPGMKEIFTDSGIYVCDENKNVLDFKEKPYLNDVVNLPNIFSNVPIFVLSKEIFNSKKVAFGKDFNFDVIPEFVREGKVKVFFQEGLWHLDIGDIKKYETICEAYERGNQACLRKLS